MKTLIEKTTYLEGPDLLPRQGDVLISEGRIQALGVVPPDMSVGAERVDGHHWLVTPGLVNAHTHVAMTLLRGYGGDQDLATWLNKYIWPVEGILTDEDVRWGTGLGLLEMIAGGVTTIAEMYDHIDTIAEVVESSGLRANLCRGTVGMFDSAATGLAENDALFKRWHGKGDDRIRVWYGPHAPNTCPPDFLKETAKRAHNVGTGIHIHVAETEAECEQIKKDYGMTPLAFIDACGLLDGPALIAHGVWLTEEDIALLKKKQVAVVHNPASNMKLASGMAPVQRLLEAGVTVALGTDGASSNNNLSVLKEARLASLLHKLRDHDPTAVPAEKALQMATVGGAKALRWAEEIGTIEVGKRADLVCFNTDKPWWIPNIDPISTLIYAAHSDDVSRVYVNGRLLYRDGNYLTLDAEKILYEASAVIDRLFKK